LHAGVEGEGEPGDAEDFDIDAHIRQDGAKADATDAELDASIGRRLGELLNVEGDRRHLRAREQHAEQKRMLEVENGKLSALVR
jgi:hypothetical protein